MAFILKEQELMKKKTINVKVTLSDERIISAEDINNLPRHTIRHFSYVDESEIRQTAARDLWDKTVNNKNSKKDDKL